MPEISRFFGLVILMYFDDHNPPHFHVRYGEFRASISIADGRIVTGALPRTAMKLIEEWRNLHVAELEENWYKSSNLNQPAAIAPLD